MTFLKYAALSLVLLFRFPAFLQAQETKSPAASAASALYPYTDSEEGLERLLREALAEARAGNDSKLESLVSEMEIPNYQSWLAETFGEEKGGNLAGFYGRDFETRERVLQAQLRRLANRDGEISTRKINGAPDLSRPVEANLIESLQRPTEIFFAGWKDRNFPPDSREITVGYFIFVEGKFRFASTIAMVRFRGPRFPAGPRTLTPPDAPPGLTAGRPNSAPASDGSSPAGPRAGSVARCDYCPIPPYPKQARKDRAEGVVVLQAIIQPYGRATDIQVLKSPRADFADAAVKAVGEWRFNPAIGNDGFPVAVKFPIEISFRLPD